MTEERIAERSLGSADFPQSAIRNQQSAIYYGWVVVACAALAMAATLPGRTHGLGLITKRLLDDFPEISRQGFAEMNLAATLLGALFCLPCGWLVDRFGCRVVALLTIASLGAAVLWLARVEDAASLAVAITLTRGIGQSMLSVVSITMVAKWFQRRIGPAMGVYSVLMTIAMAVGFGVVSARVSAAGWRAAWSELGLSLLVLAPLVGLLAASRPWDRSIEFASNAIPPPFSPPSATAGTDPRSSGGATLLQALSTPCFWVFAGSISFFGLVSSGVSLFQQYILEERGFNEQLFQTVAIIGLPVGMVANLAAGGLARRMPLQTLLATGMFILAAALAVLPLITAPWQAWVYGVVYGVAGGIITVMFFAVWGHAYGERHLGRIQSAAQMMTVLASAVGPLLLENSRLAAQSYGPILGVFALVSALLGIVALFTQVPNVRSYP